MIKFINFYCITSLLDLMHSAGIFIVEKPAFTVSVLLALQAFISLYMLRSYKAQKGPLKERNEVSPDAEYQWLTKHLDYLDEKILRFLILYAQLATATIGGAFFLKKVGADQFNWALKSNFLMLIISEGAALFIFQHLMAWRKYRDVLTKKFPFTYMPGKHWYFSEWAMIVFILLVCSLFWWFNPLNV